MNDRKLRFLNSRLRPVQLLTFAIAFMRTSSACASEPTPPPVDVIGTTAAQMASMMLTQTVAAYSPTPPPPTATTIPTDTPIPEPTKDPTLKIVTVVKNVGCYRSASETSVLISNI